MRAVSSRTHTHVAAHTTVGATRGSTAAVAAAAASGGVAAPVADGAPAALVGSAAAGGNGAGGGQGDGGVRLGGGRPSPSAGTPASAKRATTTLPRALVWVGDVGGGRNAAVAAVAALVTALA